MVSKSAAHEIQNLYLNERQFDAVAAVPDALVDAVALCGSPDRIRDQVQRWRDSPATTLNLATTDPDALRLDGRTAVCRWRTRRCRVPTDRIGVEVL